MKNIQAFDFEIKKDWWCVSFGWWNDSHVMEHVTFESGQELDLIDYIIKNRQETIFVGYNSTHFDNWCLKCIWYGVNPYKVVHQVIEEKLPPHKIKELQYKKNVDFMSFDLMQAIGPMASSLKDVEGCIGLEIFPDPLQSKTQGLTRDEKDLTIKYNLHDVLATLELSDRLIGDIESYKSVIEMFNLPKTTFSKKKQQIFEEICKGKFRRNLIPYEYKYTCPSILNFKDDSAKKAIEEFTFTEDNKFEHIIDWDGYQYVIKRGGAHYARKNYTQTYDGNKLLVLNDFGSFYLGLMANKTHNELRYIDKVVDWQEIRKLGDLRLSYKKTDKKKADGLKIPVNAAYGKMGSKYWEYAYWPSMLNVCLTGELVTLMINQDLKSRGIGKLIQVNTDGFYYEIDKSELNAFEAVMDYYEMYLDITFDRDIISKGKIVQKDVNNYIIYDEETGKVKAKGAVNKYKSKIDYYQNTKLIVKQAAAEYLLYGKPINKTVMDAYLNNEAIKFQIITNSKGDNWEGCYLCWDNQSGVNRTQKIGNINRVFATADKTAPRLGQLKNCTYHHFPDTPEFVYLHNGDIKDLDIRKINLDIQWYIDLATKLVKAFEGGE